jgi:hypothetical protein
MSELSFRDILQGVNRYYAQKIYVHTVLDFKLYCLIDNNLLSECAFHCNYKASCSLERGSKHNSNTNTVKRQLKTLQGRLSVNWKSN